MHAALEKFHTHRTIFQDVGIQPDGFSLPRQHALDHYVEGIELFGSPNGVCSSITESKHIRAVKRPWRRSSKYKPLAQILQINQRLDKLAAARVHFQSHGMLGGDVVVQSLAETQSAHEPNRDEDSDDGDDDRYAAKDVDEVDGPRVLASVELAIKPGTSSSELYDCCANQSSLSSLPGDCTMRRSATTPALSPPPHQPIPL